MVSHYIYLTTDFERIYIGRRTIKVGTPEDDTKYVGSHSDSSYTPIMKVVLHESSDFNEIYDLERLLIECLLKLETNLDVVNKAIPSKRDSNRPFSTYNLPVSTETREKHRLNQLGKKASQETKAKMSSAHTGKTLSTKAKNKLRESRLGSKNPQYKGETFNWVNDILGILEENLTVLELRDKYPGLCETNLYAVKNKRVKSHKGWSIKI